MNNHGLIAIHEDDPNAAGCIVWWRLSGGLHLGELTKAWVAAGLNPQQLPECPSPAVAARRAVGELRGGRMLVRGLPNGGWVVKSERVNAGGTDLDYDTEVKVSVDKVGRISVEPKDHKHAEKVKAAFIRYQEELVQSDVSPWLCGLMDHQFDAVRLRDTGGVYFVPKQKVAMWKRLVEVVRTATKHTLNSVPAMRTQDAVAAIEDAVRAETDAAIASIELELQTSTPGKRALANRVTLTEQIEQKLSRYEEFLGSRLDAFHKKLEELRGTIVVAITKAEAEEDAAAAAQ